MTLSNLSLPSHSYVSTPDYSVLNCKKEKLGNLRLGGSLPAHARKNATVIIHKATNEAEDNQKTNLGGPSSSRKTKIKVDIIPSRSSSRNNISEPSNKTYSFQGPQKTCSF